MLQKYIVETEDTEYSGIIYRVTIDNLHRFFKFDKNIQPIWTIDYDAQFKRWNLMRSETPSRCVAVTEDKCFERNWYDLDNNKLDIKIGKLGTENSSPYQHSPVMRKRKRNDDIGQDYHSHKRTKHDDPALTDDHATAFGEESTFDLTDPENSNLTSESMDIHTQDDDLRFIKSIQRQEEDYVTLRYLPLKQLHPDLLGNGQQPRLAAIKWMHKTSSELKHRDKTFHIAVQILDRYLSRTQSLSVKDLVDLMTVCLWLAAKYNEVEVPTLDLLITFIPVKTQETYQLHNDGLKLTERTVVITLEFEFTVPNVYSFAEYYKRELIEYFQAETSEKTEKIRNRFHHLVDYYIEFAHFFLDLIGERPSLVAAGATWSAYVWLTQSSGLNWKDEHLQIFEHDLKKVERVQNIIRDCIYTKENRHVKNSEYLSGGSVMRKYGGKDRGCVSNLKYSP